LDLANPVLTRTVSPGTYQLRVRHRLPKSRYDFEVLEERIPLQKLDSLPHSGGGSSFAGEAGCTDAALTDLRTLLDSSSVESALDRQLAAWTDRHPECEKNGREVFEKRTVLESGDVYTLHEQNQLKIRVARAGKPDSAVWKFTLITQPRGEWRQLYGFSFLADRDDHYFSKAIGDSGFVVTKKAVKKNGKLDVPTKFVPSVMFSWLPSNANKSWTFGPTVGLGYNFDDLTALIGFAAAFNENVTLTGGFAMHQQARLNGKYQRGQTIAENLEDAQLIEKSYRPNYYFGFALRLGKDPFAKEPASPATGTKPAANNEASPTHDNQPSKANVGFEIGSIKVGDSLGVFTVASVKQHADTVVITFSGMTRDLSGTLAQIKTGDQTQSCITLSDDQRKRLPAPKNAVADTVCFGHDPAALKDKKPKEVVSVSFKDLVATVPKKDPSSTTYTATLIAPKSAK
jgi:hypothetical protein